MSEILTSTSQDNEKSRYELAQLWWYITNRPQYRGSEYKNKRIIDYILKEDFDINYQIERIHNEEYNDYFHQCSSTALHMLASDDADIDLFNSLLERGADFTIKSKNGKTALHCLLETYTPYPILNNSKALYINSILSAHIKFRNFLNPENNNGISHFHTACIMNHFEAVTWFLGNGVSVNKAVNLEAPKYPGYTPLHLAAKFASFETAHILINHGAIINPQDASGMSPIDILIVRKLRKLEAYMFRLISSNDNIRETRLKEVSNTEKMIEMLLEKQCLSGVGLSRLHIACTLKDLRIAESFLKEVVDINDAVPMESPICPGYTAAHFAALNSVDAVKLLLARGAELQVEGADGLTPLDICISRYSVQDIHSILSCVDDWKDICLTDGKTKLFDLVLSMRDVYRFKSFVQDDMLDEGIPNDSALWPGSTVLHLAVILSTKNEWSRHHHDDTIIMECLQRDLNVDAPNARGQTPIHLAFRLGKENITDILIRHLCQFEDVENYVDDDNLSYLHIACTLVDTDFADILLENSDPNVAYQGKRIAERCIEPGCTPLHVAVIKRSPIMNMLLAQGANLHAVDSYGLTPIHWLLKHYSPYSVQWDIVGRGLFISLSTNTKDCVVDGLGLSYLHVACTFGHAEVIAKLLDLGADINAVINFENTSYYPDRLFKDKPLTFMAGFSRLTSLHCAMRNPNSKAIEVLLRRGADVFAKFSSSPDSGIFLEQINVARKFVPYLWDNEEMQKSMETRFGITRLHVACYMKNEEAIKSVLTEGINVNAQIHADSFVFAECTPLHLLMTVSRSRECRYRQRYEYTVGDVINLLVEQGADVTIMNANGDTPIHVFYKCQEHFTDRDLCKNILFDAHRFYNVNPVNVEGISNFHLACLWHQAEAVERFLQHGFVDVNRPIDFFAKKNPGCTPLHLALDHEMTGPNDNWTKLSQTVDLLLKYGANIAAKDVCGDTPLHKKSVLTSSGMSILETLVSYGADIKSENVKGETPIELWSFTNLDDYARIFQRSDYQMNCFNRLTGEGYVAKLFLSQNQNLTQSSEFQKWIKSSDVAAVDEMGRTVIHNSVAILHPNYSSVENFIYAIECFMKLDFDIDHQDKLGKTALHYAAQMENVAGVTALLKCGADVNVIDNDGRSAYSYPMEHIDVCFNNEGVIAVLLKHIQKLRRLGLEVSECNQNLADYNRKMWSIQGKLFETLSSEIELTKTLKIESSSLTLFDFLSETNGVTMYPFLAKSTQRQIDDFFKSINFQELKRLNDVIEFQFRKMKKRLTLIDPALCSLRALLGFSFPGLCEEITRFLTNSDLKNLISALEIENQ